MLYNSPYLINIRIFGYKDWQLCLAYWPNAPEPMKIGAGAIQLRIENGWNAEIETPSLVVLEREGTRVLYEKI